MRDESSILESKTRLGTTGRDGLKDAIFGQGYFIPKGGKQDRFIRSWMELGYPKGGQGEGEDRWDRLTYPKSGEEEDRFERETET